MRKSKTRIRKRLKDKDKVIKDGGSVVVYLSLQSHGGEGGGVGVQECSSCVFTTQGGATDEEPCPETKDFTSLVWFFFFHKESTRTGSSKKGISY